MKPILNTAATLVTLAAASAQGPGTLPGVDPIYYQEHDYSLDLKVVDPAGKPVAGAVGLTGRRFLEHGQTITSSFQDLQTPPTDTEGHAKLEFKSLSHFVGGPTTALLVTRDGYYPTSTPPGKWEAADPARRDSWKADVAAVLKPIRNPIPMHVTDGREVFIDIPEIGREYGYDLKEGQALPPLGKGKTADLFFKVTGRNSGPGKYDLRLQVRFADEGAGLIPFGDQSPADGSEPHSGGSRLRSDHEAPSEGYINGVQRFAKSDSPEMWPERDYDASRNFYFRTRIERDAEGKIKNAHYGKVYGDFDFGGTSFQRNVAAFCLPVVYFNPTPNDRNVEFDTKRNLNPDTSITWP